ncbi:proteasome maturation factor ump1 [Lichtheimia corymbifera JMRC:FSU:9682]|uniref:Proteasome maturation factor ump1 n=1 Tax=Lichtheimia corymbifera JMRC:FSU:9682 TaxID=1263082 RepID=A0A068S9A0_9FUNG|nr:proteasome maturation factor ump1 [Lichtheimia corymbifera JMRC:FSU:9682]
MLRCSVLVSSERSRIDLCKWGGEQRVDTTPEFQPRSALINPTTRKLLWYTLTPASTPSDNMSFRIAPAVHPENNTKSTIDTTHAELGGHDALRYGTRSIKTEVLPGHPLEQRLDQWQESQWELKLNMARQVHGMHAPIKMMMEKEIVSKRQRMPVMPSSNLHLDILMGKDESIDFEDFLNDPSMSTDILDIHGAMEHKLKLKV